MMSVEEELQVVEKISTALAEMISVQGDMIKSLTEKVNAQQALIMQLGENQKRLLTEITVGQHKTEAAQDNLFDTIVGASGSSDNIRDIFMNMPKAVGKDRLWQLITAETLNGLNRECRRSESGMFLMYGTLIGAIRHAGFIPWDDDIDVGMRYADFARLYEYMTEEKDDERSVRVQVSYNSRTRSVQCRAESDDPSIPECGAFTDIYVLRYLTDSSEDTRRRLIAERRQLNERFGQLNDKYAELFAEKPEIEIPENAIILDRDCDISVYDEAAAEAAEIARGAEQRLIDMGMVSREAATDTLGHCIFTYDEEIELIRTDDVFPLAEAEFEGERYHIPRNYDEVLGNVYGNYMSLPHDMHIGHSDIALSYDDLKAIYESARAANYNPK